MGIIKEAINKQIQSENRKQYNDTTATVLEYDIVTNTAAIKYSNPNGEGDLYRRKVQVPNLLGGLAGSGIYTGAQCYISFMGGNMYSPTITGIVGSNYTTKTNSDQGAYVVDATILSQEEPLDIIPMSEQWIDNNNTKETKYNTEFKDYTNTDTGAQSYESINSIDKYGMKDHGVTNLSNHSSVKVKENGDIDMFVSNNTGIRISNTDHKIYFYGLDFIFNDKSLTELLESSKSESDFSVSDIMQIIENHQKIKDIDADLEELKLVISLLKQIN